MLLSERLAELAELQGEGPNYEWQPMMVKIIDQRGNSIQYDFKPIDELLVCIEQALAMEAEVHAWPKKRKDDPETSEFDGSIGSLKENQQHVFTVFKILGGPVDSVTLEATYLELGLPKQAPSGIRTRRKELLRLGLIEWVDSLGVSPMGRSARRWQVRRTPDVHAKEQHE